MQSLVFLSSYLVLLWGELKIFLVCNVLNTASTAPSLASFATQSVIPTSMDLYREYNVLRQSWFEIYHFVVGESNTQPIFKKQTTKRLSSMTKTVLNFSEY